MRLSICSAFPGLDPIRILDYPLVDVIDLIKIHLDYSRRTKPQQNTKGPKTPTGSAEKVIYRKAGDNWF